eukprot:7717401-Pyramimonas_sp.AAC.1
MDPGPYFGNLDIRIAADLIAKFNKIQGDPGASHALRHLANEVDRADFERLKAGGLLSGRSMFRIIQTHATTREEHGQVYNYEDLMAIQIRGEGKDCLLYTSPSPRDRSLSRL